MSPRKRAAPAGVGLPGTPSGNRTDMAVQTPTGLPYGEAGALQGAQQAIPLQAAPVPGAGGGAIPPPQAPTNGPTPVAGAPGQLGGGTVAPPQGGMSLQDVLAAASAMAPPGGTMSGPTQRPNEPVTAGLTSGPGPGPEILGIGQPGPGGLAQTLQAAADASGSGLLATLAAQASAAQA